jgi:hypothetical protein
MSRDDLENLRTDARHYPRGRYHLYKARAYGSRATSSASMRELEPVSEQAEARLRAAEAEGRRARAGGHAEAPVNHEKAP